MSDGIGENCCAICGKVLADGPCVSLRKKGADSVNQASRKRGENVTVSEGTVVHVECRKVFTNKKYVENASDISGESSNRPVRRKPSEGDVCFFCDRPVDPRPNYGQEAYCVRTDGFRAELLKLCDERGDEWADALRGKLNFLHDLHAYDSVYHQTCSINFRTGRQLPDASSDWHGYKRKRISRGRPVDGVREQAFIDVCTFIECNEQEQLTVPDLIEKHGQFLPDDVQAYSKKYMKNKLQDHYGGDIEFSSKAGTTDVIVLRESVEKILRHHFATMSNDTSDEESRKRSVLEAAARIIKSDIAAIVSDVTVYPTAADLTQTATSYLPQSLRLFLENLFAGKNKCSVAGVGQAIIQATRPRSVIAPLQLGLAVQVHHHYRSKFLIETLYRLGFCSSYCEVLRFEANAACTRSDNLIGNVQNGICLFAGDNVDHNVATLNGEGSFHGMGMLAAVTPMNGNFYVVPRTVMKNLDVVSRAKVTIVNLGSLDLVKPVVRFEKLMIPAYHGDVDILWQMSTRFKNRIPDWSGTMQLYNSSEHYPGSSSVYFLPMIDMKSGDPTCILSTLNYLHELAKNNHIETIVTFDQPLFWRACELIEKLPEDDSRKSIVVLLGSFHTLMNALKAIGTLMNGSGIESLLECIYGENTIKHMMLGKAVQRAFRAHLLLDNSITHQITEYMDNIDPQFSANMIELERMYDCMINKTGDPINSDLLEFLSSALDAVKSEICAKSMTSKLWFAYQRMVALARRLVHADRAGCWEMHLRAIYDCLPLFAAAGQYNYAKSAYLYLQKMLALPSTNPTVHAKFMEGYHVIRRSNKFWAGIGSDLTIEQTLMRSLKTSGGLTRGSGMSERQRAIWTLSTPVSAEYSMALQDVTDRSYTTSYQHKSLTESAVARDRSDFSKLVERLRSFGSIFDKESMVNICTGVEADSNVNVHEFEQVGQVLLERMVGQDTFQYSFSRSGVAKTMACATKVKLADGRSVDPALLFQRFWITCHTSELSARDVLEYELCPYPPALFENTTFMRKADKAPLMAALKRQAGMTEPGEPALVEHYVLDGGSLLRRLPWRNGQTYGEIAAMYCDFITRHYGLATIVFDGYPDGPTLKDQTHTRRYSKPQAAVHVSNEALFVGKRDEFLSNPSNKSSIQKMIGFAAINRGCGVVEMPDDADVGIVTTAMEISKTKSCCIVGEDTDLLVLLFITPTRMRKISTSDQTEPKTLHWI